MASSQEAVIQELLFRLASVYIDQLTYTNSDTHSSVLHAPQRRRSLKSADDLVQSFLSSVTGICVVFFNNLHIFPHV